MRSELDGEEDRRGSVGAPDDTDGGCLLRRETQEVEGAESGHEDTELRRRPQKEGERSTQQGTEVRQDPHA